MCIDLHWFMNFFSSKDKITKEEIHLKRIKILPLYKKYQKG